MDDNVIKRVKALEDAENHLLPDLSSKNGYVRVKQSIEYRLHEDTDLSLGELKNDIELGNVFKNVEDALLCLNNQNVDVFNRLRNYIILENERAGFEVDRRDMNQVKHYIIWDEESEEWLVRNTRCKVDPFTIYTREEIAEYVVRYLQENKIGG